MKKSIIYSVLGSIVLAVFFIVYYVKLEAKDPVTIGKEGSWNESHTIYTNENGVSITDGELEFLKSISRYGIQGEEDLSNFFTEKQLEDFFPVTLKYQNNSYEGIYNDWIFLLPEGAKKVGQVKKIRDDQDRVYEQLEELEATKNGTYLGIEKDCEVFQTEGRKEVLYVKVLSEDKYYIFTQKDTGFVGEWNEDNTVYTNAYFVEIPKDVYQQIAKKYNKEGKKAEDFLNLYHQMDLNMYLPMEIQYENKRYQFSLLNETEEEMKKRKEYLQDHAFLSGLKEVGKIQRFTGDNVDRTVSELEMTANGSAYPIGFQVGTSIYQNEEDKSVLLLKNNDLVTFYGEILEETEQADENLLEEQSYFVFLEVKE